jgi:DHA1 family bicyclomycin/chloramphenicol resistance-like MFS transporter
MTASPPTPPTRPLTPLLVGTLAMLSAFAPMSIDMYLPTFPTIQAEFNTSASEVQLSLSAFMLAFGFGQIIYGPLGDYFGRRPVLLAGVVLYIAASLLCLLVQSPLQLIALRFIQGLAACAPPVMARTMVRDLAERDRAAQVMSIMMASTSMAPMLAPLIGSQVMHFFGWRAIFTTLALFGLASLVMALLVTRETMRPDMRGPLAFGGIIARFGELLRSTTFLGYALTAGFLFGAMFSFISLSSFVLIGIYGLTPQTYALVFGATIITMTLGASLNSRLTRKLGAETMLRRASWGPLTAGILLILCGVIESTTGALGWIPFVLLSTCMVGSMSFIAPNSTACALQRYPHMAGTAASLLGVIQFGCGATFGALAGALLNHSILPMALFMATGGILSFTTYRTLVKP